MVFKNLYKLFSGFNSFTQSSLGVEISERTIKYVEIKDTKDGLSIKNYGVLRVPIGSIDGDRILRKDDIVNILKQIQKKTKTSFVRISIPEEQIYTFNLEIEYIPDMEIRESVLLLLEGNIPVPADIVEFDYEIISNQDGKLLLQVAAVEKTVVNSYIELFEMAGFFVLSCEHESQALARAITKKEDKSVYYVIDIGHVSTTTSIIQDGVVVSSKTIKRGGEEVTIAVANQLNVDLKKAEEIKNNFGMDATNEYSGMVQILQKAYIPLFEEIISQYNMWQVYIKEKSSSYRTVDAIKLVGTESLIPGFTDLIEASFHKSVVLANVWTRMENTSKNVPDIHFSESVIYGIAIGLALTNFEI